MAKQDLQTLLQQAAQLELSTIPHYLFAMYSIKPDKAPEAYNLIRSVVIEEMLHLSLVCNLITATGGKVDLLQSFQGLNPTYNRTTSFYPFPMLHRWPTLNLNIAPATQDHIYEMMQIELPTSLEPDKDTSGMPAGWFETIGDFYKEVLSQLSSAEFSNTSGVSQLPDDYPTYYPVSDNNADSGTLATTQSIAAAAKAISAIVDQGEGSSGEYADASQKELSHYYKFKKLHDDYASYLPEGSVWPLPNNPTLSQQYYFATGDAKNSFLSWCSLAFTAAFENSLDIMSAAYTPGGDQTRNLNSLFVVMNQVMSPLASLMVQEPLPDKSGLNWSPRFEPTDLGDRGLLGYANDILTRIPKNDSFWDQFQDGDKARRTVTQVGHALLRLGSDSEIQAFLKWRPTTLQYINSFVPSGPLTFEDDIRPLLSGRDIQAMKAQGYQLDQESAWSREVYATLANKRMPLNGPYFSQPELKIIDAWLTEQEWKKEWKAEDINGDKVVVDQTRKLMWQRSGSTEDMTQGDAQHYVDQLNSSGFAGFHDWRVPSVDELKSLMASNANENGLYMIGYVFDGAQRVIWTNENLGEASTLINFNMYNGVFRHRSDMTYSVRAVRTVS